MTETDNITERERQLWLGIARAIAHDMGTPLSSVMGWLELLPSMKDPTQAIKEISASLERLNQLSIRLEQVGGGRKQEQVFMQTVFSNVTSLMQKKLPGSSEIAIKISMETDVVLKGQQELLEWAFECLLKNAIDAIPDNKGSIELRLSKKDDEAVIEIEDSGTGIPEEVREYIFDPGFTTKKSGRGVGLPLAKYILERFHAGKFELVSSTKDQGTIFRITMNASPPGEETP